MEVRAMLATVSAILLTGTIALLAWRGGSTSVAGLVLASGILLSGIGLAAFLVWRNPQRGLDPLPWFLTASAAYFGFGPLAYYLGARETIDFMHSFYPVTDSHLFQTGLLDLVGIGIVVITSALGIWAVTAGLRRLRSGAMTTVNLSHAAVIFLLIGTAVRYGLVIPRRLGLIEWVVPGMIEMLAVLLKAGILLGFVLGARGHRGWKIATVVMSVLEMGSGLLLLSKLEVIEVLIVLSIASQLTRPDIRKLAAHGVGILLVYLALSPAISYARMQGAASLTTRTGTETVARSILSLRDTGDGIQSWWARLAYTNQQGFALDAYNQGRPGRSLLDQISSALIPRLLKPDKPIMTHGIEYTRLIMGRESESSSCPTPFAEGYWSHGWFGALTVALWIGLIVGAFTGICRWVVATGRLEYLPLALIGLKMGYRIDDWFVTTHVLPVIYALVLFVIMRFLLAPAIRLVGSWQQRSVSGDLRTHW
jgi:hypothetical protein